MTTNPFKKAPGKSKEECAQAIFEESGAIIREKVGSEVDDYLNEILEKRKCH